MNLFVMVVKRYSHRTAWGQWSAIETDTSFQSDAEQEATRAQTRQGFYAALFPSGGSSSATSNCTRFNQLQGEEGGG